MIRQLEIIGEASKRVTADLKAALPSVPWRRVAGMRDKLTHDYMGVDLDAVWRTAKADLAPLKEAVREGLQRAAEAANSDS